ncbi:putative ATP synthase subunit f-like protein [Leptotrombidium deliense]|uniref:Putative ATP synthase subunit f-like protein n=1 Tax=Leptotrombidium deliense TaxID=299467 RepID=A0A443SMS6_9ACAR|nr:putative ATP synthase subunit f-like protein [Leptotrombidium deliense]
MNYIKSFINSMGCYPLEYNRAVHGPYDPCRYYGKPDTHVMDLKISEIPGWLSRRRFDPYSMICAVARWRNRHQVRYIFPYKSKSTYYLQMLFLFWVLSYANGYKTTHIRSSYLGNVQKWFHYITQMCITSLYNLVNAK